MSITDQNIPQKNYGITSSIRLLGDSYLGQYYDHTRGTFLADWRLGDVTTQTLYETPAYSFSSVFRFNYKYRDPSNGGQEATNWVMPKDANWEQSAVYSTTTTQPIELQLTGETVNLYVYKDASFGTANIYIDNVLQGLYDWSSSPASVTQIATMESTEGWDGSSTNDTVIFKTGSSSRRVTNNTASTSITSKLVFKNTSGVTFSGNNPVSIASTGHGLSTGNVVSIVSTSAAGALANGNYTITVIDADNFTVPFNGTGAGGTCNYSLVKNYSSIGAYDLMRIWIYVSDATLVNSGGRVTFELDSTSSTPGTFTNFYSFNWSANLVNGWNECVIHKNEWTSTGSPSWSTIYKAAIVLRRNSVAGNCFACFDDTAWIPVNNIFSATGLSPYDDHILKIVPVSGKVNVAHTQIVASKVAVEMHRDSINYCLPALVANYAYTGDTKWAEMGVGILNRYIYHNQLGDLTAINRSRAGALGVGGFEEAYYISPTNKSNWGDPTTTSSSFDCVAIGLALLAFRKTGYLTTLQMNNGIECMRKGLAYAYSRGYFAKTYYNTGNNEMLWADAGEIYYQLTGDATYRIAGDQAAFQWQTSPTPPDLFLEFFAGTLSSLYSSDVSSVMAYLDEKEENTTLPASGTGSSMTSSQTHIPITVGGSSLLGFTATNYTVTPVNAIVRVDSEPIYLTTYNGLVGGFEDWNCTRGYLPGSTAVSHLSGANISRGFDIAYSRVQCPAIYLYGILTKNQFFKNMAKAEYNAVQSRITLSTLAMDISGGSRDLTVTEGYVQYLPGMIFMSDADNQVYPNTAAVGTLLEANDAAITQYGWIPSDSASNPVNNPSNIAQSFGCAGFVYGWVNCLLYADYFSDNTIVDQEIRGKSWRNHGLWRDAFTYRGINNN